MTIYVCVDAEGLSGIYLKEQTIPGNERYAEGQRAFTRDIAAVCRGLRAGGADRIIVHDMHYAGTNVRYEELPDDIETCLVGRMGDPIFPPIDEADGVVLLGYHAMAGTHNAILEHTMSSGGIQNWWMNGQKVGEIALHAGVVGDHGKPVILVTGDDKACAEAEAFLPGVVTATVKKAITTFGASLLPPAKAVALLEEKAALAVRRLAEIPPYRPARPVQMRIEVTERTQLPSLIQHPYVRLVDGHTFEAEGADVSEAFRRMCI